MAQGRFFKEQIATLDKVGVGTITPSESIETTGNIKLADNGVIKLGDTDDLQILHNGSDSIIKDAGTGNLELHATNLVFRNHLDSAQYASFINGGAVSLYFNNILKLSTSASGATIHGDLTASNLFVSNNAALKANGSGYLELGNTNSGVIQVGGDGTDSTIAPRLNNLKIQTSRDADDIIFLAGASTTELLRIDASTSSIRIPDTVYLQVGSSSDLGIAFDGTNSIISNVTNDLNIQNYSSTGDINIQATNGSGGVVTYLTLDGSQQQIKANKNLVFFDNKRLRLGTSADADLYSTNANIIYDHNNYDALFRHLTADKDFVFSTTPSGGSLTEILRIDASASSIVGSGLVSLTGGGSSSPVGVNGLHLMFDSSGGTAHINAQQNGTSNRHLSFKAASYSFNSGNATFAETVTGKSFHVSDQEVSSFYQATFDSDVTVASSLILHQAGNFNYISSQDSSKDLIIRNTRSGKDMVLQVTSSGGTAELFRLRGISSKEIVSSANFEIRNGTSSRHINLYETYTDSSNYERSFFKHASSFLEIGTEALGTGTASGLKLKTAGADRITVLSGGNVGIGTNNPSSPLSVVGTARIDGASGDGVLTIANSAGSQSLRIDQNSLRTNTSNNLTLFTSGNGSQLVLHQGGNVGIGTNDPFLKFHVDGNSRVEGNLMVGSAARANTPQAALHVKSSSTNARIRIEDSDNSNQYWDFLVDQGDALHFNEDTDTRVTFKEGGNVGIGTTSPLVPLHVQGTALSGYVSGDVNADTMMVIENNDNARLAIVAGSLSDVLFGDAADQDVGRIRYNHSDDAMIFFTNGSEKVRIKSGGEVGIGTTSPDHTLRVNGDARLGNLHIKTSDFGQGGTGKTIYADGAGSGVLGFISTTAFDFSNGATSRLRINSAGNVGIGTTSPNALLHVKSTGNGEIEVERASGALINIQAQSARGVIGTDTNHELAFKTNAGTRLTIGTSGNTTLAGNLTVQGNISSTGTFTIIDTDVSTTEQLLVTNNGTGPAAVINQTGVQPVVDFQDDGTSVFYIKNGGNVGIGNGITNPSNRLHVETSDSTVARFKSTTNKAAIFVSDDDTGGYFSAESGRVSMGFNSGLHVDNINIHGSSGNFHVGIGTTSPSSKLTVDSNVSGITAIDADANAAAPITWRSSGTLIGSLSYSLSSAVLRANSGGLLFQVNGSTEGGGFNSNADFFVDTDTLYVDASESRVGIGTSSPDTYKLQLGGAGDKIGVDLSSGGVTRISEIELYNPSDGSLNVRTNNASTGGINFHTQSSPRVTIARGGNVGIGTTSPTSAKLQVENSAGGNLLTLARNSTSKLNFEFGTSNVSLVCGGEIQFRANGGTTNKFIVNNSQIQSNAKFLVNTSSGIDVHTSDSGTIIQSGNSSATSTPDQFFLKHNSGGVEIGNERGDIKITKGMLNPLFSDQGGGLDQEAMRWSYSPSQSGYYLSLDTEIPAGGVVRYHWNMKNNGTAYDDVMVFDRGNVHIGGTDLTAKLSIRDDGSLTQDIVHIKGGGSSGNFDMLKVEANNGDDIFRVNAQTYHVLMPDSDTKVGIGTTIPSAKLSVHDGSTGTLLFHSFEQHNETKFYGINDKTGNGCWEFINDGTWDQTRFFIQDANNSHSRLTLDIKGNNGSTDILSATSTGRVGIGTTTPSTLLHLSASDPTLKITDTSGSDNGATLWLQESDNFGAKVYYNSNSNTFFNISTIDGGTEDLRFSIKRTGETGIGTGAPRTTLHVVGPDSDDDATAASAAGAFLVSNSAGSYGIEMGVSSSGDGWIQSHSVANNNQYPLLLNPIGSNVGIGTTNPLSTLHIGTNDATNGDLMIGGNDDPMGFACEFISNNNTKLHIGRKHSADSEFIERVTIIDEGKVGIGTTSPARHLHINGGGVNVLASFESTDAGAYLSFSDNSTTNDTSVRLGASGNDLQIFSNGQERIRAKSTGEVGIGTTTPTSLLHVHSGTFSSGEAEIRNDSRVNRNYKFTLGTTTKYIGTVQMNGNGDSSGFHVRIYDGQSKVWREVNVVVQNSGGTNFPKVTVEGGGDDVNINVEFAYVNRSGASQKTDFYLVPTSSKNFTQLVFVDGFIERDTGHSSTSSTNINLDTAVGIYKAATDDSSKIGIGTVDPDQKLHVKGDALRIEETASTTGRHLDIVPAVSGQPHKFTSTTTGSGYHFENSNGLIAAFEEANTNFYQNVDITSGDLFFNTNGKGLHFDGVGSWDFKMRTLDSGSGNVPLIFESQNGNNSNPVERFRINSNGNALFSHNLTVNGTFEVSTLATPNAPTNLSLSVVGETINVTFTASTTSNIDSYLVYSSVDGSDYGLISIIPPDDFGATMSIIDSAFTVTGTQAYRVYAVKAGKLSSALSGNISYTVSSAEPTNLSVVALNNAFYIQYDPPSSNSRFVTAYKIFKHEHANQGSLDRTQATEIYSGMNKTYMYQISGSNNTNFHQFWVETTIAT